MSIIEDNEIQDLTAEERAELENEMASFAKEEKSRLGLDREQYTEDIHTHFTASQRAHTTLLVSGLTVAHDELVVSSLEGIGYKAEMIDVPNNEALQVGKEFGNRGQCSPTYFTVGNLVKHLIKLRDEQGMSTEDIISSCLFVTAGACGPCRFGTYVTEYRKALRDAGFDGFRVMLFQQQGGLKQATGEGVGLELNAKFGFTIVRAMIVGDVLNLLGYRLRPYEVVPGATDAAMEKSKAIIMDTFRRGGNIHLAVLKSRKVMGSVKIDRSQPKPIVSVIGEFWAMTTEGEGNYNLQRFLEQEGAEVHIQSVTNWILFMIWENKYDTEYRMELREHDDAKKGLEGTDPTKKLWGLAIGDKAIRAVFHSYAKLLGLNDHHLPNLDEIASLAGKHYDNHVRGGEAHMEVGKLIHFVEDKVNHMTVSVKPFGCMPSSGVSDGVQSLITAKWPEAIFLPIETTGDGEVNVHSRVLMMMFKARQRAVEEFQQALAASGMDEETFKKRMKGSRRRSNPFWRPKHHYVGIAANMVHSMG